MSTPSFESASPLRASFAIHLIPFFMAIVACLAGMIELVAQWDRELATVQFLLVAVVPIVWMIRRRPLARRVEPARPASSNTVVWTWAMLVGAASLTTSFLVGRTMTDLPPAYHDEYSYLFQSQCLLSGQFSVPSHPAHPELFDQMHVLNEGRMASRYYPGTGFWLAPFVALGHPYWGHWIASAIAAVFVFWTGYEIGNLRVAVISGFTFAVSPGVALFSNLLLAHQPTLAALSVFTWSFVTWQRTQSPYHSLVASSALSYSMLCRPATAAGFGLPFGMIFVYGLVFSPRTQPQVQKSERWRSLLAMGLPIVAGLLLMFVYNRDVTGSGALSPYQVYTDIYTPRHVYGFDNVVRGERKMGPKVIDAYDRWAVNLTPQLALENTINRLLSSWMWTFDLLPQLISTIIVFGAIGRVDRRWTLIGLSIVSLHAIHVPYWYSGIMGWHYVFESVLAWSLLFGLATDVLLTDWKIQGRRLMPIWWGLIVLVSFAGNYLPIKSFIPIQTTLPKIAAGIGTIEYPRRQYGEFDRWLKSSISHLPALVLIETDPDDQHVDFVMNSPQLNDSILRGRYRVGQADIGEISKDFPDRSIYLCRPKSKEIELIR